MDLDEIKEGANMLDLLVLRELERKKKIPREWLLGKREKVFVVRNPGKKEQKSSN